VNVEDVQHGAVDGDVGAQASALLPSDDREVVVPVALEREAAEDGVAVPCAVQFAVLTERAVHAEILRDALRLIGNHFLQSHHAGIDSVQDFGDA
jgi:hypothetical protein